MQILPVGQAQLNKSNWSDRGSERSLLWGSLARIAGLRAQGLYKNLQAMTPRATCSERVPQEWTCAEAVAS